MWYVSLPDKFPSTWDEPGSGKHRLLRAFDTKEDADNWVTQGCPGALASLNEDGEKVFTLFKTGWNRLSASPKYFWLDGLSREALEYEEQQKKFAWFRWQARVSKHEPPLPPHEDLTSDYAEYIWDEPEDYALATAHLLRELTLTSNPEKGLTEPPISDNM